MQQHAVSFSQKGSDKLPEHHLSSPKHRTDEVSHYLVNVLVHFAAQVSDILCCKSTKSELTGE